LAKLSDVLSEAKASDLSDPTWFTIRVAPSAAFDEETKVQVISFRLPCSG
jgi:hypothetical protein